MTSKFCHSNRYLNNAGFHNNGNPESMPRERAASDAPIFDNGYARLYQADARELPVADRSVHCVVTSPPYWGLRDYSLDDDGIGLEPTLSEWLDNIVAVGREVWRVLRDDGVFFLNLGDAYAGSSKGRNADGTHSDGDDKQHTNAGAVNGVLRPSFRRDKAAVIPGKRVERGQGSGRWGMGDTTVDGLPAKNLMGQPWRAAFALQDDGWILRSAIVWHKPNPCRSPCRIGQPTPTKWYSCW